LNLDNAEGETALHAAAKEGHLETVKLLIAAGADPTIKTDGGKGFTAADLAWLSEKTDVAKYLDGRTGP
jgi:ankyrin repeat protein